MEKFRDCTTSTRGHTPSSTDRIDMKVGERRFGHTESWRIIAPDPSGTYNLSISCAVRRKNGELLQTSTTTETVFIPKGTKLISLKAMCPLSPHGALTNPVLLKPDFVN